MCRFKFVLTAQPTCPLLLKIEYRAHTMSLAYILHILYNVPDLLYYIFMKLLHNISLINIQPYFKMESFQNKRPLAISLTLTPLSYLGLPMEPYRYPEGDNQKKLEYMYHQDAQIFISQIVALVFLRCQKTLNTHRALFCEFSVQVSLKNVHLFAYKRENSILYVYKGPTI